MTELSEEEYIALWKRLNPYFVSHVTRQGFRDHNVMVYHSGGMNQFSNGLVDILKDEKLLRSPLVVRGGLKARDESSVREWLSGWVLEAENEGEAEKRLIDLLHRTIASAPKYPDETAVHFANQIVADSYYGGERNNEVFIVYPSDVIASQYNYAFNGWEKDFTKPQSEQKWNDVFVWPRTVENPGVSIDAGIVFLPDETPVDPGTGSRYACDVKKGDGKEEKVMIEDKKLVEAFTEWFKQNQSRVREACKTYEKETNSYFSTYRDRTEVYKKYFSIFTEEFLGMGFKPDDTDRLTRKTVSSVFSHSQDFFNEEQISGMVRSIGVNWKRAEKTITAKEYWEKFFQNYPHLRPKHVEYYNGDPTSAVYLFQRKHNIGKADTSGIDGVLLGFDENHVSPDVIEKDPRSNPGYEELVSTARRIIKDHYGSK
ncbi:MAG: hypothetical protein PHP25_03315 [Candidatus Moranbacteria bacterium]|nr:hypothetical protein [Candidatus Moranbacteria bacterium]